MSTELTEKPENTIDILFEYCETRLGSWCNLLEANFENSKEFAEKEKDVRFIIRLIKSKAMLHDYEFDYAILKKETEWRGDIAGSLSVSIRFYNPEESVVW